MRNGEKWEIIRKTSLGIRDWLNWTIHYKRLKEEWEDEVQGADGRLIYYRNKTEKELSKFKEKVAAFQEQINKQALLIQSKENKIKELNSTIRNLKIKLSEKEDIK